MMGDNNNINRTLVLVGRTGNGKSATGNTILGRNAFVSKTRSSGVTKNCELQNTVLKDGQIINIIDTPGIFDSSIGVEFIGKEILGCIDLAKDGIHAVLVVFSVKGRFSEEEAAILDSLRTLFGNKIVNYMIVVFTGGDELENNDETLEDYLGNDCPQPLKDILILCGNRKVLFDNKTKNESKRKTQIQELLSLVNMVVNQNDGKPYTNKMFDDMTKRQEIVDSMGKWNKQDIIKIQDQMQRNYEDLLCRVTDMIEGRLKETIARLEEKLAKEEAARKGAEKSTRQIKKKLEAKICKMKENLDNANKELYNLRNPQSGGGSTSQNDGEREKDEGGGCSIL